MADVQLTDVRKEFGDTVAVSDVPLDINDGELLVLLGPSGCGKSTTLRLITGLEFPTEGTVTIGGRDVTGTAPHKRDIAMVFQDLALYPHKSVRQNMAFGLKMRGYTDEEANQRVERAAELLQIEELLDRSPKTLSGGQQQRVAIGRAIVRDPEVFLFDEPLSDLDAKLRADLRTEILELHQELQATMVYVTHDQEEAMTLGDRIAVMNNGQIHQLDEPDTIYNRPVDLFVARFIGNPDMNFFDGTVTPSDDDVSVETDLFSFEADGAVDVGGSRDVTVGVRAENFHTPESISRTTEHTLEFTADVRLLEMLGDHVNVYLKKDGHEFVASFDRTSAEVGDTIDVILDLSALHYFDSDTGERITELDDLKFPMEVPE